MRFGSLLSHGALSERCCVVWVQAGHHARPSPAHHPIPHYRHPRLHPALHPAPTPAPTPPPLPRHIPQSHPLITPRTSPATAHSSPRGALRVRAGRRQTLRKAASGGEARGRGHSGTALAQHRLRACHALPGPARATGLAPAGGAVGGGAGPGQRTGSAERDGGRERVREGAGRKDWMRWSESGRGRGERKRERERASE